MLNHSLLLCLHFVFYYKLPLLLIACYHGFWLINVFSHCTNEVSEVSDKADTIKFAIWLKQIPKWNLTLTLTLCLCFPPLANWSSFPHRDRMRYQPCWTDCLQRCPCWWNVRRTPAFWLRLKRGPSISFDFSFLWRYFVLIFLVNCVSCRRGMWEVTKYQNKYSDRSDEDHSHAQIGLWQNIKLLRFQDISR